MAGIFFNKVLKMKDKRNNEKLEHENKKRTNFSIKLVSAFKCSVTIKKKKNYHTFFVKVLSSIC